MPEVSRYVIIFNPTAGRGRAGQLAGEIQRALARRQLDCDARPTRRHGDAGDLATQAMESHTDSAPICVVACGGDGTVQQVASAVAGRGDRAVMGLAPAGRCNDFARALSAPASWEGIVECLVHGAPSPIDLGRAGDRYFCTIAATGFDAVVSRFVNEMWMPLRGAPAYFYGTLRALMSYKTPRLRLTGDFETYEGPVFLVATANTPWYGGSMKIAPQACPRDGLLDLCLVTGTRRTRVLRMLTRVSEGRHVELPEVRTLRTRKLTIESIDAADATEVWADGESIGRLPVRFESVPGAVRVMLPANRAVTG